MNSSLQVLAGLAVGLLAGAGLAGTEPSTARALSALVQPFGTLFINAIRMTVIPLIVAKLVVSIASAGDGEGGLRRLGATAAVLFPVVVLLAATFGAVGSCLALPHLRVPADAPAWLGHEAGTAAIAIDPASRSLPNIGQWLEGLVPPNAFKAASDGALLPLVVFALAFGAALTRVAPANRDVLIRAAQGVADAMTRLLSWILIFAPAGVFALALPLAARTGIGAAGVLAFYVVLVVVTTVAFMVAVLYPAAVILGGIPFWQFVRGCLPVQVIAFSSRSSLASLPVMVQQGRMTLHLPETVTAVFMPIAAAMFRPGSALGTTIGALFLAHVYGVALNLVETTTVVLTAVVTMFGSPGVPSGAIIVILPILASAGVPVEGIGILLGVDTLPDMFRTTTNVTADMAGASVISRLAAARQVDGLAGGSSLENSRGGRVW